MAKTVRELDEDLRGFETRLRRIEVKDADIEKVLAVQAEKIRVHRSLIFGCVGLMLTAIVVALMTSVLKAGGL